MKKFKVESICEQTPKVTDSLLTLHAQETLLPRSYENDDFLPKLVQVKLQCGDLYQVSNIDEDKCAKIGDILIADGKYWTIVEMGEAL